MRGRLRYHPRAADEVDEALRWYADRSRIAARAFLGELEVTAERVLEAPERHPRYRADTRRLLFPRYPFSLIYRTKGGDIEVVAVAHHRRRPGYWIAR